MGQAYTTASRIGPKAALAIAIALGIAGRGSVATANPADEAAVSAMIGEIEHDPAHAAVATDPLARARDALERARRLGAVHDDAHAAAAYAVAREWAETARDLVRATDAEAQAAVARRQATDTHAQAERTRALVEEAVAHVGRLKAELARALGTPTARTAVEVHAGERPTTKGDAGAALGTAAAPHGDRSPAGTPPRDADAGAEGSP